MFNCATTFVWVEGLRAARFFLLWHLPPRSGKLLKANLSSVSPLEGMHMAGANRTFTRITERTA